MSKAVSDIPPEQRLRCSICYNPDGELIYLKRCKHIMHSLCLQIGLRARGGRCPTCTNYEIGRGYITNEDDIIPIHVGDCPHVNNPRQVDYNYGGTRKSKSSNRKKRTNKSNKQHRRSRRKSRRSRKTRRSRKSK